MPRAKPPCSFHRGRRRPLRGVRRPGDRRRRRGRPVTVAAAGDIACPRHPCDPQRRTARIIRRMHPRAVLPLGDNQYPRGSLSSYRHSYGPTWGEFRHKTYPVPGNHEYDTRAARGYFRYFKRGHGPGGYYSYNLGDWHLIALNSERRTDQKRWLRRSPARSAPLRPRLLAPTEVVLGTRAWRNGGRRTGGRSSTVAAPTWC